MERLQNVLILGQEGSIQVALECAWTQPRTNKMFHIHWKFIDEYLSNVSVYLRIRGGRISIISFTHTNNQQQFPVSKVHIKKSLFSFS